MNLLNMLLGSLTNESSVNALSQKTGAKNSQIVNLIIMALPLIIKALTKNASSSSGATSLLGALTQHTSRDSIDRQIQNADTADGAAILNHILGNNTSSVTSGLAQQTGLSNEQVSTTLDSIAPAILSGLSAATTQAQNTTGAAGGVDLSDGLDFSDLMGMFMGGQAAQPQQTQSSQGGGLLSGLLGSLLGGNSQAQPQTQQSSGIDAMSMLSGLLGSGGSSSASSGSSASGMLSSLLGGSSGGLGGLTGLLDDDDDDDANFNGASLLSALLGGK